MKVIYPGSFDPLTNGHLDIIERCSKKFDHVIVAILNNPSKKGIFTIEERMILIRESIKDIKNVKIDTFTGLLIDYAKIKESTVIIRGLRAVSDFEYEMQMALANKTLYPDLETFFMVSSNKFSYLSSSIVREVAFLGGDISFFVPKVVEDAFKNKIKGGL